MFVGITNLESPQECLSYCRGTTDCEFFTHFSTDNACFAFINCVEFNNNDCDDCISGDKECADITCDSVGKRKS